MEKTQGQSMIPQEASGADEALSSTEAPLAELTAEQQAEAQAFAVNFLKTVIRLKGVKIEREDFLRKELRKTGCSDAKIAEALSSTPAQAGFSIERLDALARASIDFETKKSAALSFAAGLPGGFAMLATVPGDVTQYYVHAFRIMQKLSYLYGWQDFLGDLEAADDETVAHLAVFLGVMMGVGGASLSLANFAQQVARPAIQKQITNKALTKTVWYPVVQKTLKLIGVKVTKDSFAKGVTKVIPVAGGVISGGMTLISLKSQSTRLLKHLREVPPPGVDAAEYLEAVRMTSFAGDADALGDKTKAMIGDTTAVMASGARTVADAAAGGAKNAAREAAKRMKGLTGLRKKTVPEEEGQA